MKRNIKKVSIHPDLFLNMLRRPQMIMSNDEIISMIQVEIPDLPKDAEFLACYFNLMSQCYEVVITSSEWPEIPVGGLIPELKLKESVITLDKKYVPDESFMKRKPLF
jgi:hypothetical protein